MKIFNKTTLIIIIVFSVISCNKKRIYNTTVYNLTKEDTMSIKVEYDSVDNLIEFEYNKELIVAKLNGKKLYFDNTKIKSDKIKIDNKSISFDLLLKNQKMFIGGIAENIELKEENNQLVKEIKDNFKDDLIDERRKLNANEINSILVKKTKEEFQFKKEDEEIFKDGDLVVLFESKIITEKPKWETDWLLMYNIKEIIGNKHPFLVVFSNREVDVAGNRFQEGGLTRSQVGATYDYANYKKTVKFLSAKFLFYNIETSSIYVDNINYLIYYNKIENEWIKEFEGLQNFSNNEIINNENDASFLKKNIINYIFKNNSKLKNGVVKNNKIIWNNNYSRVYFKDVNFYFKRHYPAKCVS
jgi:hypothetical protein